MQRRKLLNRLSHLCASPTALMPAFFRILLYCFCITLAAANTAKAAGVLSTLEMATLETVMEAAENEADSDSFTAADIDHVQDLADILTDEEEEALREECISIGEAHEIDIFILTTDYTDDTRKAYLENFYDTNDDILSDAVLILVDMEPDNRGVEIQGYGQCEFSISDSRIEAMLDEIVPYLSEEDYSAAFFTYIDKVDSYMSVEASSDYVHTEQDNRNYNENYYEDSQEKEPSMLEQSLTNLFIAAVIGGISVAVMTITTVFSRTKMTTNGNTYIDSKHARVLGHWDRYIRTTTTRTRKPQNNNNNSSGTGFGGGGVSSGGHSHSGGGRSF